MTHILPPGTVVPATASGRSPDAEHADDRAWQREMERAQAEAWFKEALRSAPMQAAARAHRGEGHDASGPTDAVDAATRAEGTPHRTLAARPLPPEGREQVFASRPREMPPGAQTRAALPTQASTDAPAAAPTPPLSARGIAGQLPATIVAAPPPTSVSATPSLVGWAGPAAPFPGQTPNAAEPLQAAPTRMPRWAPPLAAERLPVRWHCEVADGRVTVWLGLDAQVRDQVGHLAQAVARWSATSGYGLARLICNGEVLEDGHPAAASPSQRRHDRAAWLAPSPHLHSRDSKENR